MANIKKTVTDQEKALLAVIAAAKKKLARLQEKQTIELGELACKHGLHQFDVALLDEAFAKLAVSLRNQPAE